VHVAEHRGAHLLGGRQEDQGAQWRPVRQPPLEPYGPSRHGTATRKRKTWAWTFWALPSLARLRPASRTEPPAQPPNSALSQSHQPVQHGPRRLTLGSDHYRELDPGTLSLHHSLGTALSPHQRRQMGRRSPAPSVSFVHNTNPRNQRLRSSDCAPHKSSRTSHRTPWASYSATCA
jgi:hypothetical protein